MNILKIVYGILCLGRNCNFGIHSKRGIRYSGITYKSIAKALADRNVLGEIQVSETVLIFINIIYHKLVLVFLVIDLPQELLKYAFFLK